MMLPKICTTMAFLCFTLLAQPNSIKARPDSNSKYLLVELDGSPDMNPGSDATPDKPDMPEPKEEPTDDLEPETLPEDNDESAIYANSNAAAAQQGGYRSSN